MRRLGLLAWTCALSLAACDRDVAGVAGAGITEGATVSGTLSAAGTARLPDGSTKAFQLPPHPFEARIGGNGVAAVDRGRLEPTRVGLGGTGQIVAVSDAASAGEIGVTRRVAMDARGRLHTLTARRQGRRPLGFTHEIDGKPAVQITPRWRREEEGWYLESSEMTLFGPDGAVLQRLVFSVDAGSPYLGVGAMIGRIGSPLVGLLAPAPLHAQSSYCSGLENQMLMLLSLSVIAAATGNWWAATGAMIAYYGVQNTWYENCY